ncbi:MAG: YraN family protein, partial [Thiohalocapsa sp.]
GGQHVGIATSAGVSGGIENGKTGMSGLVSHCAGLAAEDIVLRDYRQRGYRVLAQRWRGQGGEIDLIFAFGDAVVFVEVKKARDIATAAARLSERQMQRLYNSAGGFLAGQPNGMNTEARFDVALVNGTGAFEILENAFGH